MSKMKYVSLSLVLAAVAIVGTTVALQHTSSSNTVVVAQGGGVTGGGSSKITLPADFPKEVPLPNGKLIYASGASPFWSTNTTVSNTLQGAKDSTRALYTTNGYNDLNPNDVTPYQFDNGIYLITTVYTNHDHSATSTDVGVNVRLK